MSIRFVFVLAFLALAHASVTPRPIRVRYLGLVMPSAFVSGETPNNGVTPSLVAGQEARLRISLAVTTRNPSSQFFNASSAGSGRIRIIPAFASRGSSGTRQRCSTHTDYWQEFWGMSSSTYRWGEGLVTQAFVTFTVPPFPYRACFQAVATNATMVRGIQRFVVVNSTYRTDPLNGIWTDFSNIDVNVQNGVNASALYVWNGATTNYEGDYAAIRIVQNGFRHNLNLPAVTRPTSGDAVKLVPAGFPCTYEHVDPRRYCGTNRLTQIGNFHHEGCLTEGSIRHGVARIGTNQVNPYSMSSSQVTDRILTLPLIRGGEDEVAYLHLAEAGTFDVCFSPKARRVNVSSFPTPVWFKIFRQDAPCTGIGASTFRPACRPTGRLVVAANADPLRWSTPHIYPGTWGAIRIFHPSGTPVLNTAKASRWELSSPREFFSTEGGDQFRLVETSRFTSSAITFGNMFRDARGTTFKTVGLAIASPRYSEFDRISSRMNANFGASDDSLRITFMGTPDHGTRLALSSEGGGGCWNGLGDNYGNYARGLNGINTNMASASYCCSTTSACTSTTSCSMSDTDHDGVTASADLGADPRSHQFAWTHNSLSTSEAWAYIRFPIGRRWNVCYRQVGTENWRVIRAATGSVHFFDALSYQRLNFTYHVNDSQATTWGPLTVRDPQRRLTTLNYNYVSASPVVVGSAIKIVTSTQSCYTDIGEAETFSGRAGLLECEVGQCGGSATCPNCPGHSDNRDTPRWDVTFYVRMPAQLASGYYRVCFKNGVQNWMQLQDPQYIRHSLMTSPWRFNTRPAPSLDFALMDWREGTWGKFLFRRLANANTHAFNIDRNNAFGAGDVVRLVPNRTASGARSYCDITWGATAASGPEFVLQNFDPALTTWNLGLFCRTRTTARCSGTNLAPAAAVSGDVGTYPYTDIDSTADGSNIADPVNEGAVAFITIPPRISSGAAGYRLCYKPQAANWIEVQKIWNGAPNPLLVAARPPYTFSVNGPQGPLTTIYAGSYGYITISGGSINLNTDLVKLVLDTDGGCDRPAAGQQSVGNAYASFSWRRLDGSTWTEAGRGGQAFVADSAPTAAPATLGSRATTTAARAYMTFPTISGLAAAVTPYKVCFMTRSSGSSDTSNWQLLGTVNVESLGIAYTAENQPYNGAVLGVRFVTGGRIMFNTLPRIGDAAKVVSISSPCLGVEWDPATTRPSGIQSRHVGQEVNPTRLGLAAEDSTLVQTGEDDLGDSNLAATSTARMELTLPWVGDGSATYYKVCFRPRGLPWMEIGQAPLAQQVYALGSAQLLTSDAGLSTYTMANDIRGQDPFSGAVLYAPGILYNSSLVGGAATASVGTTNVSFFSVAYRAEFTSFATDTFKLVRFSEEVVRGVYRNLPSINCRSRGLFEVVPGVGSVATSGAATRPSLAVNLPTEGGRYLLCYRKTGLDAWIQLEADATSLTNPFRIIPNSLSFSFSRATGNFTVTDLFSATINSRETALGAVSSLDRIYIVNASDTCGLSHGFAYDPRAPGAAGSLAATIDTAPRFLFGSSNVSQTASLTAPTAAGWYKVCYRRTSQRTMATATGETVPQPFTRVNWYQIRNAGELANGGNTPFFVTAVPSRLRINGCPRFNTSNPLRTGMPFDISVSVLDGQSNVLPFSVGTWSYLVTAVAEAGTTGSFSMTNARGSCRAESAPLFGWDASNLRQWTSQGVVTFSLAILSGCPSGGCSFTFSASDSIRAPGGADSRTEPARCTVQVRTTRVNALSVWDGRSRCRLDEPCSVTVAAFWTDGGLAHTATDDVLMTVTNFAGLSVRANAVALTENTPVRAGSLLSGFFVATILFDVTNGALFAADTNVVVRFAAAGRNASQTITIVRPRLTRMHIVDLYPEDVQVTGLADADKFVRPFMVPSWEPLNSPGYFLGALSRDVGDGSSEITAAPGYNLVALQVYTATLRPVDGEGRYIDKVALLDPARPMITLTNTASSFSGNSILRRCDTDEVCDSALAPTQLSSVRQKISFRLRNAIGCSVASPCTLTFKFDGTDLGNSITSITTPVRSMATGLRVTCWRSTATTEAALGAGTVGACPSSTVETGLALKVEAIDANGRIDEYFEGNLMPLLRGGNGLTTDSGLNLTTVAALRGTGAATIGAVRFSLGVAWIFGLTLTKPCASGCNLQLVSDWGANLLNVGPIVLTPSTVRLTCSLSTQLYACVVNSDGNCESISGFFNYDSAVADNNRVSLIYRDTQVCATVTAVNADGVPTLYETNWVMYWAQATPVTGTTVNPVTITDAGNSPTRVRAMVRSSVSFCFRVGLANSANTRANFRVRFAAQRFNDATYWARQNGECNLGTFTIWARRHVANLAVARVTDPMTALSTLPASTANLYAQRADLERTALGTTLSFLVTDHYGNTIPTAEIDSTQTGNSVVISACSLDDTGRRLATTCTASSIDSTTNIAMSTPSTSNQREGGVVRATLTSSAVSLSGDVAYVMTFDRWCLGCFLTFRVRTATGEYKTKFPGATDNVPTARVNLYIVIFNAVDARVLAFRVGTSPWTSYWQRYDSTLTPVQATGSVAVIGSTCFTTSCNILETWFQPTVCDEQTTGTSHRIAASSTGTPIQMYVVSATTATGATTTANEPACGAANDCNVVSNIIGQVDILNTYSVSVDIGSQILQCSGSGACIDDLTPKPRQIISALGATAIDAVRRFIGAPSFSSTNFIVSGVTPSNYYVLTSGRLNAGVTPTFTSRFTATVESNTTGLKLPDPWTTTGYVFAFRGPKIAQKFVILPRARESRCLVRPTYPCHGTAASCSYDGYQKSGTIDDINFGYARDQTDAATIVPVNTDIPISSEVQDANNVRVATARGTVLIDLFSWSGCNNGGTLTVRGAINNREVALDSGRITAWISFSAPCENCVLRFTLVPDSTQSDLYNDLNTNRAQLVQFSSPIDVRDNVAGSATHLLATSVPSDQRASVTVADRITVNMIPVRSAGGASGSLLVQDRFASGEVYAYNRIQTTARNWFWFGNGGVLRRDETSPSLEHHTVSSTFTRSGAVSITFAFSRTCPGGCSVVIAYSVNRNFGSFTVRNAAGSAFVVSAASTRYVLVGFRPRMVEQGTDFALSLWHAGEGPAVPFAGVGSTTLSPSRASKTDVISVNGDGGDVVDQAFVLDRTEIHRLNIPRTCNRLRLAFGSDSARLNVFTTATSLRVERPLGARALFLHPMTEFASFSVLAVDDLGFVDVRVGGYTGGDQRCFSYMPLSCPATFGSDLTCTLSANGITDGGFSPSDDNFLAAKVIDGVMSDTAKRITDGQAADVRVRFDRPVRNAFPIFKVGSLTSAARGQRQPVVGNIIDVSVGRTGLNIVTKRSSADTISMFTPLTIEVGLVRVVADDSSSAPTSYIAVEATNPVRATLDASCPALVATASRTDITLNKGYAQLSLVFAAPTAGTTRCTVTVEALAGSGVCTTPAACRTTFQISVTSVTVSKWFWISPSALDNTPGLPAGPYFGAQGRTTIFRIGLLGRLSATQDISVNSCDDPSTPTRETCTLTVTPDATCTNRPTIGAVTWNETIGQASVPVTWADVTTGTYTCKLTVAVTDGANRALAVDGNPGGNVEVSVCKPAGIILTTNTSSVFRNQFLRTGQPYSFSVAIVDSRNVMCRGDSGDSATELTVDLVSNERTPRSLTTITAYNVNLTNTAFGWIPPNPQTAKAVAGGVTFSLVFSNSSVSLGLGGFRVRIAPSRGLPTDRNIRVDSDVLDTVIAARLLRFNPDFDLPRDWVMGRPLRRVAIQAIDGVDRRFVPNGPNIARRPNEIGNNAFVSWRVDPLPSSGFPLTFTTGQREQTLTRGEADFAMSFSTPRDGVYGLSVGTAPNSGIQPSEVRQVNFQAVTDIMLMTRDFRPDAPAVCGSANTPAGCVLPNRTFSLGQNVTQFLNTTNLRGFNVSVLLADVLGRPVVGESDSFVQVRLVKSATSTSTVTLTIPNSFTARASAFFARVTAGVAGFSLGFTGSTMERTGNVDTPVTLEFSCPATVPASIAGTPRDYVNPCAAGILRGTVSTLPIRVIDPSVPSTVFESAAVQAARQVFIIPTTATSIERFNVTKFKEDLAARLSLQFPFITRDNAASVVEVNACDVNRDVFGKTASLGSSVCGPTGKCSGGNTECPTGVIRCRCNSAASLSALLGRYLLQTSSRTEVQVEATFNLRNAVGFAATSEGAIADAYAALATSAVSIIRTDRTFAEEYGVDTANVGTRAASAPVQTVTPAPTPSPPRPTTIAPTPPPPTTEAPTPSSAYSLRVSMTTVLAALFLLVLYW